MDNDTPMETWQEWSDWLLAEREKDSKSSLDEITTQVMPDDSCKEEPLGDDIYKYCNR